MKCISAFTRLFLTMVFFAAVPTEAMASACEQLNTLQSVFDCALERHPSAQAGELGENVAKQGIEVARQRANPEVNNQTSFSGNQSATFYTELNFTHTFELGGKRDSRIRRAEAELKRANSSRIASREDIFVGVNVALYRLRQIEDELKMIDGSLSSFAEITKQYKKRAKLNPEQSANLRIFEIAEQDYRLRRSPLESEFDQRLRELEYALGQIYHPKYSELPQFRTSWPKLIEASSDEAMGGSRLAEARANVELAQAELQSASSLAWPDLKIGPTLITQRQNNQSFEAFGFNFSLPLPLYHRNEAGRTAAEYSITRNSILLRAAERERDDQKAYFKKRYETVVHAMGKSISVTDLEKKHSEVEKLFKQGFINGSLLIEIHRQVTDLTRTRNEQELAAVESFIRYQALNGTLAGVEQ